MSKQTRSPKADIVDLSSVPPIYILSTHILPDDLHYYEDQVYAAGGALTYNAKEARIFLGKITQKKRATFELRTLGVWTDEGAAPTSNRPEASAQRQRQRERKRRKLKQGFNVASSSTSSENEEDLPVNLDVVWPDLESQIIVLKLEWLDLCLKSTTILPYTPHLIYSGKLIPQPLNETSPTPPTSPTTITYIKANPGFTPTSSHAAFSSTLSQHSRRFHSSATRLVKSHPPKLHRTTTSEHDALTRPPSPSHLPLPTWTTSPHSIYSCCRSTPSDPSNAAFIVSLTAIKLSRILTLDSIGVRAYSTAIASLSALPFPLTSESTIHRIPGCNTRIAELWREWHDSASDDSDRFIQHVKDLEADPDLRIIKTFYNIWGVGADTARKFLYEHHFHDLDDLVEYHWTSLTRVQQIGVKFYEEFQIPIPQAEVESIAATIHDHARRVCSIPASSHNGPDDVVCVIVGGHRRGKPQSGDVDVILSHRSEALTKNLVIDVVRSLESEGWVTHTLTLQTTTSQRDQQTLPYRGKGHGHGFDSLDKALCVWQDPHFDSTVASSEASGEGQAKTEGEVKNPNIHRRVDIILSPHRTLGCAVLGWSGGTTFQRDLRRFVSKERGWKFDSSGVRDRGSGAVMDLESPRTHGVDGKGVGKQREPWEVNDTWEDRERRVMEGLGVGWRPAKERCTG